MINDKILLQNGYKEYKVPSYNEFAKKFYQKRIKDGKGTKYFIDFYVYYDEKSRLFDYECNLEFETKTFYYMNVKLFGFDYDTTLEEIELRAEKLWKGQDCRYYEEY